MSNISGEDANNNNGSFSSEEQLQENEEQQQLQLQNHPHHHHHGSSSSSACKNNNNSTSQEQKQQVGIKKKRNQPGNPDPNAEVIALSPTTLMATNRFICEICNKGFQRDQNLQLHRRGHNLPWKLRQRATTEEAMKKRVYVCPEKSCVHHNPARALGDLTGIKKHYSRKHGEKKWKCDKCSKKYAVQSDWKAHQKTCGTREYKCDCGTIFSRRDSFITHRAFCDALTEENNRINQQGLTNGVPQNLQNEQVSDLIATMPLSNSNASELNSNNHNNPLRTLSQEIVPVPFKSMSIGGGIFSPTSSSSGTLFGGPKSMHPLPTSSSSLQLSSNNSTGFNYFQDSSKNLGLVSSSAHMSATALLQKAAQMGAAASSNSINSPMMQKPFVTTMAGPDQVSGAATAMQHHNRNNPPSYDHHFNQQADQFFHKRQQEMPLIFEANNNSNDGSTTNNDIGMLSTMFMGSDHNTQEVGATSLVHERDLAEGNNQMGAPRFGVSNDMKTVHDFLGVGGSTSRATGNLHEPQRHHHHQQEQQRLELEALSQQRLPLINHFQHHIPHGDSTMEKSVWDI
ncbi:zinc finger protein GAI-ASSOCIATED FACTOR 1-like [Arachis stenosperma]|uniref:zinc finger protein GAI-ASSOCIATED FACTOR 1-like n=1 Tax=Arachis stenosperma TaxID=217475 RepID=UPI0025AC7D1C|nr:zinc finger protein GAI-ASSOCIATED FACTOR 1-like [Arachis stenosperma]